MIQTIKKNKKGFTLVELIVVIAILGVLMAVLVPQYIQYVEKSKIGVDDSYIGEVGHAAEVQVALTEGANVGIYTITFTQGSGAYVVAAGAGGTAPVATALDAAIKTIVPVTAFKSNHYTTTAPAVLTLNAGVLS